MMPLGVYVHFPYCTRRCPYCDFAIHVRRTIPHERYADAVLRELSARAPLYEGRDLVSVYFGGGTPGLWQPASVARVLAGVCAAFHATPREVTLEANPGDLAPGALHELRAAGVDRLSLGVQTFGRRHLVVLGRTHGPDDAGRAVAEARAAGFTNLSLDLIFALPDQTLGDLDHDLARLCELAPEHLSIYSLTVEERTPFGALSRARALPLPGAAVEAEMFERIDARLTASGFEHYEISSYARPGRRAIHNSLYWSGGEWLGLGSSAHSFRRLADGSAERFSSLRSVDRYFAASAAARPGPSDPLLAAYERLPADALAREALWLGLRLLDRGIDRSAYAARFGFDPLARFHAEFARLVDDGLVAIDGDRLRLTPRGALFADEVGARFL
jgi:oxygen-independent coproporphyrinogen-3 oxidase